MVNIIHSFDLESDLAAAVSAVPHDRLFVLCDTTTAVACWPMIRDYECMADATLITIGATDDNKTVDSLAYVWSELGKGGSRRSLLVNLGGGMVTDLGGFAASTFKRGIAFVNIPTTLLAMVDASVGGKTGINFGNLKNEIGVFNDANAVIINTRFLHTLDTQNIRSGYAEMLKHALISTPGHLAELLTFDIDNPDLTRLSTMVATSVAVKEHVVAEDPHEHGIRKALNLGHTVGHALESHAMRHSSTVLHGYAVAWGLVCELYLSCIRCAFPTATMRQVVHFVRDTYGYPAVTCNDYDELYELMTHDKKNHDGRIICTLLGGIGDVRINQEITRSEIEEIFDFLREG